MAKHRVLFIDDDPDVLRSLGNYFEQLGNQVFRAPSGKDGIAMWEQVRPDVTVLDLYMPEMNGLEVLEVLRRDRAMVIMLTGHGDVEAAVEAMNLGAENFLTKPIEMSHLVQAVQKAAEKGLLRRENVELRARLHPSIKKRAIRAGIVLVMVAAALVIGQAIGGSRADRVSMPIPIPLDTTSP